MDLCVIHSKLMPLRQQKLIVFQTPGRKTPLKLHLFLKYCQNFHSQTYKIWKEFLQVESKIIAYFVSVSGEYCERGKRGQLWAEQSVFRVAREADRAGEKNLRFGAKRAPCRLLAWSWLKLSLNLPLRPFTPLLTPSTQSGSDSTYRQSKMLTFIEKCIHK